MNQPLLTVHSFSMQVAARCRCGGIVPLHTIAGHEVILTECPKCHAKYAIEEAVFRNPPNAQQTLHLEFHTERPELVMPKGMQ